MAKSKADERTFTGVVDMERTCYGEYLFKEPGGDHMFASEWHSVFRGLARWFRKPYPPNWEPAKQHARVTIEILPEEETK